MKQKLLLCFLSLLLVNSALIVSANSIENLLLKASSPQNLTTDDLNCTYNLAGTATTSATAWYKNKSPLMVLYMPMEGNETNALRDYSGSGNNGAKFGNPTWNTNTGYDGNGAFQFDGASYIDAGFCMPSDAYTKSAWVRFIPGTYSNNIISGNNGGHAFFIINDSGYRLESGHNGVWNSVWDPALFPENVWTFVSLTYDSSIDNGLLILYKNGVEVARKTNIPSVSNDARVLIGTYSAINLFNGYIDDARVYSYALSPEQISSLYNKGRNIIASAETKEGEQWQCNVTSFNSTDSGATKTSNTLTIKSGGVQQKPLLSDLTLIASSPQNLTTDDLNCTYNLAGTATTAATAWYKNNLPLMVLYIPMEGNEINALLDYSGNGNNGDKVGNILWDSTGGYDGNGALKFDGATSYIAKGGIMPQEAYTKSAWVKFIAGGTSGKNIISGDVNHAFYIVNDAGYRLEAGHNTRLNAIWDPNTLPENVWTFVSLTYDSSINNGTLILYKNGVEVSRKSDVPPINNDPMVLIGSFNRGNLFNGSIDDARLYNYALSPEQISSLYNKGRNIIASSETKEGEEWQCRVTPFSETEAGTAQNSNNLIISTIGKITISLKKGWNLISIPLNLTNNTLPAPLNSISGKYSKTITYSNGKWIELKENDKLNATIGFWINMTQNSDLVIEGNQFNNLEFNLKKGWNLVGYPYSSAKPVSQVFDVSGINSVSMYNNSIWRSYNPNRPNSLDTLEQMEPGYGYWVDAK